MRHRQPRAAPRDRASQGQEGGLIEARLVGSYPGATFTTTPPWPELAVIGRSNVGKSSLINAFLGRRALARTSRDPGKTRLCNVFAVDASFYLLDLPGYGFARVSQVQRSAFTRMLTAVVTTRRRLIGVLWLLDIRHAPSADDHAMHRVLGASGAPVLVVVTKSDKLAPGKRAQYVRTILDALQMEESQCVMTSARTGDGIADLRESVAALLEHGAQ